MAIMGWLERLARRYCNHEAPPVIVRAEAFGLSEESPDNSAALQQAIDFASEMQRVTNVDDIAVGMPKGTFIVAAPIRT